MTEVTSELVTQEPPDVETMLEQTTTEERHECNEAAVKGTFITLLLATSL